MSNVAILQALAGLAVVVTTMLILGWLARKHGWLQGNTNNKIKVIGSHRLGPRSHISIIEIENTRLVLGITPTNINHLHTFSNDNGSAPTVNKNNSTQDNNTVNHETDLDSKRLKDQNSGFKQILKNKLLLTLSFIAATIFIFAPELSHAQATLPALTLSSGDDGNQTWSLSVQTLILLTLLSFLPAMLLTMTGFTRIIIVLSLMRNAMGTGASPPNSVLIGLALFLTFFSMSPVFDKVYETAWQPLSDGQIEFQEALQVGVEPFREFMLHQTRQTDLIMFADMAGIDSVESPETLPLRVLIPSFVTSELKTAFQIGFTIFIPFLIIDLLVASTLMSLGMMMVPPVTIALPFKLMLFVLADGWHLLLGSLARSFYQ